jgi:hypothetical protein
MRHDELEHCPATCVDTMLLYSSSFLGDCHKYLKKLSSVERDVTLIVTHFRQLFSQIFGETMLIVTNIWPNPTSFRE